MRNLKIVSIILLVVILACLPMVIEKDSTINLLILIFLYIVLASSWNILGGYTGQTTSVMPHFLAWAPLQRASSGQWVSPFYPAFWWEDFWR